jgi:hypothetical protein
VALASDALEAVSGGCYMDAPGTVVVTPMAGGTSLEQWMTLLQGERTQQINALLASMTPEQRQQAQQNLVNQMNAHNGAFDLITRLLQQFEDARSGIIANMA